jgi:uncharacterized protein with GYD domain
MPRFLHQVSYTSEAMSRLIANPQDRFEAVRGPIEKLGGKIEHGYFAFGEHDAILITDMPDNVSAAAIALAFAAGGIAPPLPCSPLPKRWTQCVKPPRAAINRCRLRPVPAAAKRPQRGARMKPRRVPLFLH